MAHRILRDIDLAEDATQQALLAIWRDLPQLRDPARFDAWSYRLLVRACYAEGRRTRQWTPNLRLLPADEPAAAEGLSSVVDRDQLERGFRRLSIDHRAVVVLHHYLDLPLDEVAETLGVPVGTVRSRLHHAMRGLRAALEADARPATREAAPMSTDRDVTRIVRSWLEEGVTALPDRVLDAVLDQLPATPQRRARWPAWRLRDEQLLQDRDRGCRSRWSSRSWGSTCCREAGASAAPSPTPTSSPTPSPIALPSSGPLQPGTYTIDDRRYTQATHFVFTVPAGWTNDDPFVAKNRNQPGEVGLTTWVVSHVYANSCMHTTSTLVDVGTSPDKLVDTLVALKYACGVTAD